MEMKAEPENPWQKGIWMAQMIDSWRIFPRMFLSVYIFLLYYSTIWFMELPNPLEQSGLISIIVGAGAAGHWFGHRYGKGVGGEVGGVGVGDGCGRLGGGGVVQPIGHITGVHRPIVGIATLSRGANQHFFVRTNVLVGTGVCGRQQDFGHHQVLVNGCGTAVCVGYGVDRVGAGG